MEALLVAALISGLVIGLIVRALSPSKPRRPLRHNDKLDTVDEMFLYGEVNDDDFYRM
ncbi:MAG: hypothetical protein V3T23_03055 [Nitrososphaerales archaeon]